MNARKILRMLGACLVLGLIFTPAMRTRAAKDPDPVLVKQALDIGTDAYIYGYPLVTMEMTRQVMTNVEKPDGTRAPMGQFVRMREYPTAGYGGSFCRWAEEGRREPYNSWGNGSAMRVSPVGTAFDSLEDVVVEAQMSAAVTHSHPEGVKGAQAFAQVLRVQ